MSTQQLKNFVLAILLITAAAFLAGFKSHERSPVMTESTDLVLVEDGQARMVIVTGPARAAGSGTDVFDLCCE